MVPRRSLLVSGFLLSCALAVGCAGDKRKSDVAPSDQPPAAQPARTTQPAPPTAQKPIEVRAPAATPPPSGGGGLGGVNVRFGIAPADYEDPQPGVLIGEVFEGTSADLAGLKAGDRMTKWNGKTIDNVEAWMPFLSSAKPGDVVDITYLRDGKEMTTKVTLQGRTS